MSAVATRTQPGRRHADVAHHHPGVLRTHDGWAWACSCGAATPRVGPAPVTWRRAFIDALRHSTQLAA